jgi:tetratricopeptide (TPR) repeat protein
MTHEVDPQLDPQIPQDSPESSEELAAGQDLGPDLSEDRADDPEIKSSEGGRRIIGLDTRGSRWVFVSVGSAVALTVLIVLGIYLVAKRKPDVDQIVILTVPSGAEVMLNSKSYGRSPVKIERLAAGTYRLTILKENFEPVDEDVDITGLNRIDRKLKPVAPGEVSGLSTEEIIRGYIEQAQDRFVRGRLAIPWNDSALYYTRLILGRDESNQFALEMNERIHNSLMQSARTAVARNDVGQAQEIYYTILEQFPTDEEAKLALVKLDAQLSQRRGEIRDLVRKAEDALRAGYLIEPLRASAYYYSKEVLAIDKLNERARAIRNQINERLKSEVEHLIERGDLEAAAEKQQDIVRLFPEDHGAIGRLQVIKTHEQAKANESDPDLLRRRGLENYRQERYGDAANDLEQALSGGRSGNDLMFALARSFHKLQRLEKAAGYYRQVTPSDDDSYRSAIAALGDIAHDQGDQGRALERYREARRLGGSTLYTIGILDDKIDRIEKRRKEKEAEPVPVTIRVRHEHRGVFGRSCQGPLTIDSTGIRYDGSEHVFASNLVGANVKVSGEQMVLQVQKSAERFKVGRADGERFREALSRYQMAAGSSNKQ